MPTAITAYENLVARLTTNKSVTSGQMFGKACLKVKGKAFISLHNEKLVFKLTGEPHQKAMALKGAELWDPSGKGRPMKEWVALPIAQARAFNALAENALAYVAGSRT
jgi:hypothetical protein